MTDTLRRELKKVQALRSRRGITLSGIAQRTCISLRYLEAIEAEQWNLLPGGVYRINYVRQYVEQIDPTRARWVMEALATPPPAVQMTAAPAAPFTFWQRLSHGLLSLL